MPTVIEKIQETLKHVKRDLALLSSSSQKNQNTKSNMVAMFDQVLEQLKKGSQQ